MDEQTIKLVLQLLGVSDIKSATDALQAMASQATAAAPAVGQTEKALEKAAAAAEKAAKATQAAAAANAASLVEETREARESAEAEKIAAAAAQAAAAAKKELADAAEMVSAAERHEAEMSRMAAESDREEIAAVKLAMELKQQAAMASAKVNMALAAEANSVAGLSARMGELNAAFGRGAISEAEHFRETLKLTDAYEDLAAKSTRMGGSFGLSQQRITGLSYVMNDFFGVTGDLSQRLNAIANNLPMLLAGFGNVGLILSGVVPIIGMMIKNWDSLIGVFQDRTPFPKAAGDVAGLKRELEAAKTELEKFEKAGVGTAAQLERYNELRARSAQIEKEVADAMERTATIKKLFEAPTATEAEAEKERVEQLQEIRGPAARQLASSMARGKENDIRAQIDAENMKIQARINMLDPVTEGEQILKLMDILVDTKKRTDLKREEELSKAAEMVGKATMEGKLGPFRAIQKAMAERPEDFRPDQIKNFAQASPEALKAAHDFEEEQKRAAALAQAQRAKDKAIQDRRQKEGQEALQDPALKADLEEQRRTGRVDAQGRRFGTVGFDQDSADQVARRLKDKGIAKAPEEKGLPPLPTDAGQAKFENRQRAANIEGYARDIFANSQQITGGLQFTPQQARAVAARAFKVFEEMGVMADEGEAIMQAAREQIMGMGRAVGKARGGGGARGQRNGFMSVPPSANPAALGANDISAVAGMGEAINRAMVATQNQSAKGNARVGRVIVVANQLANRATAMSPTAQQSGRGV